MLGFVIVTKGYLWVVILVVALYFAIKPGHVLPVPLGKKPVNPIVVMNVERLLATALAFGVFIVGMLVFASLFSGGVGVSGYCGL